MAQIIEFFTRHPLLVGATLAALVAALINEVRLRGQSGLAVPATAAVRLINQGAVVVDLREKASFDGGHIVDAINVGADELAANAESRLKKKRTVIVVCDTGTRSSRVVSTLRRAGFENAWSLSGGVAAWQRDNLPLVASRTKA